MRKTIPLCLIGTALSLLATSASAESITMTFEQALDLDTGTIIVTDIIPGESTGADVWIAYNADRVDHAVVFPALGSVDVEMAFITNTSCSSVTSEDVAGLTFSSEPIDQALSTNNCVVVRTDQGVLFKLGGAIESESTVTINYTQVQ